MATHFRVSAPAGGAASTSGREACAVAAACAPRRGSQRRCLSRLAAPRASQRPAAAAQPPPSGRGRARSPSPPRVAALERPPAPPVPAPALRPRLGRSSSTRPQSAYLLATATDELDTGGVAHSQEALANVLAERILSGDTLCCPDSVAPTREEQAAKARRLFEAVGVRRRGSRHTPARFFDHEPHPLGSARGSCQDEFLMPRLLAAGQAALQRWTDAGGEGAGAITHLIVGGLTAPRASPGPDVLLATALGLPRTTQRTPLHHLGCLGGYRALAVAADVARSDPGARVLVVYGDVSSLIGASLQSPMNEADLLSIAIFTDGAAAAVVGGSGPVRRSAAATSTGSASGAPPLARIAACRSALIRGPGDVGTADQMWLRESGFRPDGSIVGENFVGKGVPKHLLRSLAPFVNALLAGAEAPGLALASTPVLCHPGGPAILDVVARALQLQPWQLAHSWAVLGARGNMSGATNLFVLHDFLQAQADAASGHADARPSHAVGIAFGPGLAVEGIVLEML